MGPLWGLEVDGRVDTLQTLDVVCGAIIRGTVGVDIDRANRPDVVADATVLPFRGEIFDKVISIQSLEHLWQPPLKPVMTVISALVEFSRVIKKGGILELTSRGSPL